MDLTKLSIKRPVALTMVILIILILGGVSLSRLPMDLMPNMDIPMAVIYTSYPQAGPYEVENIVTKTIESAIATTENVKSIQSQSSEGTSIVIVEFAEGTDMNFASLNLREKLDLVKAALPDDASSPMVMKMNMDSMPIASLTVTAENRSEEQLKGLVEDKIQPRFERLSGVASISMMGGRDKEIKVTVDPGKLSALGLSTSQIMQTLASENYNQAGGLVDYGEYAFNVRTENQFQSVDDVLNLPLLLSSGGFVYLRDVATVEEVYQETTSFARVDGKDCMILSFSKSSDANTVNTMRDVRRELEALKTEYPDLQFKLINDQAEYIELAINNVATSLLQGAVFAVLVLFLFLRNVGMTAVVGLSIPISVIATFVLIYFSGTSLNMVSLGGLALGVGMLVDNSVVVLENIYRHRTELKLNGEQAGVKATKEVRGAVVSSTLTTIVVFLPIIFVSGIVVQIFKDMALTIIFSLVASLVVAITLVPMLSAKMVKNVEPITTTKHVKWFGKLLGGFNKGIVGLNSLYGRVLNWSLRHKKRVVILTLVVFIASMCLIPIVGLEFIPSMDEGSMSIGITLPKGTKLEDTNAVASQVEQMLLEIPEMDAVYASVGSGTGISLGGSNTNTATVSCELVGKEERKLSTAQIADNVRTELKKIPGVEFSVSESSSMMGGAFGGAGVSYQISGPDMDTLQELSDQMISIIEQVEGTREVNSSLSEGKDEFQIKIDRDKASMLGLTSAQVASNVRMALEGTVATTLKKDGTETDIRVTYPSNVSTNVQELEALTIKSPYGSDIPLSALAEIERTVSPTSISRSDQERYITVSATIIGRDMGTVNQEIEQLISQVNFPDGYTMQQAGQMEMLNDAVSSLMFMLILAVVLVFMVMAAQFESLLHPFVVMFSIPLAFTGSAILLFVTGTPLSVPGLLGMVMLVGIVVNNGIVLVDYINQLRKEEGMELEEAIRVAGPTRLRPILMTALTTILGLIPMALSQAEGAEMQRGLALVVMGGLTTSTVLTLVIVPLMYIFFDRLGGKFRRLFRRKKKDEESLATL